ncbi:Disco-interacting protein [Nesidiocoris tenuis]|uniref:Disco-interacting protein n=1 Tax=Nesidiocoris tenuis TaxID=355587 RepID=A0ABN7B799_9HEMI|nr:Disco-interacting protein [Nesidiocoris tenuis]
MRVLEGFRMVPLEPPDDNWCCPHMRRSRDDLSPVGKNELIRRSIGDLSSTSRQLAIRTFAFEAALKKLPNGGSSQVVWEERSEHVREERGNREREKARERERHKQEITDLSDVMHNLRPYSQPPDVTHNTGQARRITPADRVNRYNRSRQSSEDGMGTVTGTGRWKVSAKIQQLLNTLKRPKRRPLPEFYEDDDIELELAANPKDPNAPKPEGATMTPAIGEQLVVPSGLPRNLEAAIQRYGSATYKAPVATVLDPNGKLSITLTYGKLLSRSQKIAYTLLTKNFSKGGDTCSLKCGDRIALVYPNNDPINFMCAFYGCMFAGIVPVPIEVPITRRDAGSQQIGFLLGSCGVQVALTSEACLKGLPKTATGEVVAFKGWPKLQWFVTEHLAKTPKDWTPTPRLTDDNPAYIEYSTDRDGSVMGVTVTRAAMLSNCRMLTMSCNYTEGENMVCVLDFKRETGLWHSILTSVLNGMHVVFIPYALMKVNPASWMQMITKYRASVAVVKSRDLHWGLLATKDHKDISLSSLRLLLVGDGANPWSLSSCDQFLAVFQAKGLRTDAICPSASSTECLTVSLRSFLSLVNRRLSPRRRCPPNGGFLSPSGGSRDDFLPLDAVLGSSRSPRILSAFGPSSPNVFQPRWFQFFVRSSTLTFVSVFTNRRKSRSFAMFE